MECYYINVDGENGRRQFLEANFSQYRLPGWNLTRVGAVNFASLKKMGVKGGLQDAEKSCFLSHRKAIEQSLLLQGHALILEDDAMFGPRSCECTTNAVETFPSEDWDLIFTDVGIYNAPLMSSLLQLRRELQQDQQMLLKLSDLAFYGACAYVVNERSKERLLKMLDVDTLDVPYDVFLRDLIQAGQLRAFVAFPFCTSISPHAEHTQIQFNNATTDLVFSAFRRFIWIHRDLETAVAPLEQLGPDFVDAETRAFARILAAAQSTNLQLK